MTDNSEATSPTTEYFLPAEYSITFLSTPQEPTKPVALKIDFKDSSEKVFTMGMDIASCKEMLDHIGDAVQQAESAYPAPPEE